MPYFAIIVVTEVVKVAESVEHTENGQLVTRGRQIVFARSDYSLAKPEDVIFTCEFVRGDAYACFVCDAYGHHWIVGLDVTVRPEYLSSYEDWVS